MDERYEMKFLGINIKDMSSTTKLLYVGIFAAVVIAALFYGLSNLDQKQTKQGNKRRSPKKDSPSPKAKNA